MIALEKLEYWAQKNKEKNYKFRIYLKIHADPEELDRQFKELHDKYFSEYDCSKCRNCCTKYCGTIPSEDIPKDAESLGMTTEEFIGNYLKEPPNSEGYNTKNCPCDFLVDNDCILGDNRPDACKEFPHTDKEDRMGSLLSIIGNTSICPVVYEIMEELKKMYGFH